MAITLDSISKGKANRPPRIILLGVEKIGKSTFAAGADSPIFLPVKGEEGIDDLDVAKFPSLRSYSEVLEAIGSLFNESHDYGTVIIDSASTLEPLVWDETCKRENATSIEKVNGGFGKGYTEALSYWREITDGLDALRTDKAMGSILIGHVATKSIEDPTAGTYTTFEWDINKKAAAMLYRWADVILFANTETIVRTEDAGFNKKSKRGVGQGDRFLFTQKRPAHPGGGRGVYGQIPYKLPLSWAALYEAVAAVDQPAVAA